MGMDHKQVYVIRSTNAGHRRQAGAHGRGGRKPRMAPTSARTHPPGRHTSPASVTYDRTTLIQAPCSQTHPCVRADHMRAAAPRALPRPEAASGTRSPVLTSNKGGWEHRVARSTRKVGESGSDMPTHERLQKESSEHAHASSVRGHITHQSKQA